MGYKDEEKGRQYKKLYRLQNKERIKKEKKEYYLKNKEDVKKKAREYYHKNKEKVKERRKNYRKANIEKIKQKGHEYWINNKEKLSEYKRNWNKKFGKEWSARRHKERWKNDIQYKLSCNLRGRLWGVLKGTKKSESAIDLVGCTLEQLKVHLEAKWKPGMSWDNYGLHGWHIDHILPANRFDLTDEYTRREIFHYTNLQPMWAKDNISKSDTLPFEHTLAPGWKLKDKMIIPFEDDYV